MGPASSASRTGYESCSQGIHTRSTWGMPRLRWSPSLRAGTVSMFARCRRVIPGELAWGGGRAACQHQAALFDNALHVLVAVSAIVVLTHEPRKGTQSIELLGRVHIKATPNLSGPHRKVKCGRRGCRARSGVRSRSLLRIGTASLHRVRSSPSAEACGSTRSRGPPRRQVDARRACHIRLRALRSPRRGDARRWATRTRNWRLHP